jgi:RNA polymerase sigma-70 factor (ECF subfamily)
MPEHNYGKQTSGITLDVSLCDWEDLYRFIYYKVQNREEAEDITQEAYARAYTFLGKNNTEIMNYASYLKSVAVNIIRDRWRNGKKVKSMNIDEADPQLLAVEDFADAVLDREVVESSMKALSREQQMVLELRIIKGYSVKDTARLMDKKAGYIRVLQHRAVKALARLLGNI